MGQKGGRGSAVQASREMTKKSKGMKKNKPGGILRLANIGADHMAATAGLLALVVCILGLGLFGLWYYTSEAYMVMAGEEEVTIGLNGYYEDPGVEAKISGRNVTHKVDTESDLDPSRPGTYTITYTAGNFHARRTVRVLDHMTPELTLSGGDVELLLGEEYEEPGYEARDEKGRDLTDRTKVSKVDLRRAGKQEVRYTVTDDEGRATRLTRTVTVKPNTRWGSPGIAICMFHYVYDENDPPDDLHRRYGNYISAQALIEEMEWLKSEDYYFPTWKEVRAYVDGKLILPDKSVVLTFDDGERYTLEHLLPVLEACRVPVTSFLITSKDGEDKVREYTSEFLFYGSHTHDMHRAGGVPGHKGIFPVIGEEEGLADLETSVEIVGSRDAFAYPYGDYSESAEEMLRKEGFLCAVTTQPGRAYPGDDPLLLPRQRMSLGQSLEAFKGKVAPPERTESAAGAGSR